MVLYRRSTFWGRMMPLFYRQRRPIKTPCSKVRKHPEFPGASPYYYSSVNIPGI